MMEVSEDAAREVPKHVAANAGRARAARRLVGMALFLGVAVGFPGSTRAAVDECPVKDFDSHSIEDAARSAPSCERSLQIFRLCSSGASGDVGLGAAVTERCEGEFLDRLTKGERQSYQRAQQRCARKYRHELGTMYRSFQAYCRAEVALFYARRLGRRTLRGTAP